MIPFRTQIPEPKAITALQYPPFEIRTMQNGIRLYCIEPSSVEVVKISNHWATGSIHETNKFQAKTALSLALNGSETNSAQEILERFDYWGTSVSPSVGVLSSGIDIKTTKEFFNPSLEWFFKHFELSAYPESELISWKQTHVAELGRRMSTPKYWAYRQCMEMLFGINSPMSKFTEPGDIESLVQSDLNTFKNHFLNLSQSDFFISGDYDDATLQIIIQWLSSFTANSASNNTTPAFQNKKTEIHEKLHNVPNTSQVSLFMAAEIPEISETEYHHFSLLNTILGGFFGSRLMQDIREEKGLTYGIGSYIQQTHSGNMWCISGEMNSKNAGLALDETRKLLRGMISNPATGAELERAKRYYTGQLRSGFDGPFSLAGKLRSLLTRGYTTKYFDTAMDSIWNCTTQDLCELADNYLHPETFKTVLAGDIG